MSNKNYFVLNSDDYSAFVDENEVLMQEGLNFRIVKIEQKYENEKTY